MTNAPRRATSSLVMNLAVRPGRAWMTAAAGFVVAASVACRPPPPTVAPDTAPAATADPSARPAIETGTPSVKLAQRSDRPSSEGALDPETARAETARILGEVAKARNLEVTRSVKVDVMDKDAIRAFAKKSMYEDTTPEEFELMGRIEITFGKLPVGSDPEQIYLDLLEDGVLGLYDPKRKTLFIGDFVSKVMLSMVVGHEIAHGLQDMHFDLEKHQEPLRHRSDEATARRFLIEGGAQSAYFAWVSGEDGLSAIEDRVLDAAANQTLDMAYLASPYPVLARSLQMPYTDGTATVTRLVKQEGWQAIDALYAELPATSEQMLHLDKLRANEQARPVSIDGAVLGAALPGLTQVWHDQIGEADLLAMIADVETSLVARRACAGWGGDQFLVFDDTNNPLVSPVVAGVFAWDSVADAKEAQAAWARYLRKVPEGKSFVHRKGDTLVFGLAIPERVANDDVRDALWRSVAVGKAPKAKRRSR